VLSSLIWICTTTNNNTKVVIIDANKPDIVLETFHITCQAHIGCIASVPGKYYNLNLVYTTFCNHNIHNKCVTFNKYIYHSFYICCIIMNII